MVENKRVQTATITWMRGSPEKCGDVIAPQGCALAYDNSCFITMPEDASDAIIAHVKHCFFYSHAVGMFNAN